MVFSMCVFKLREKMSSNMEQSSHLFLPLVLLTLVISYTKADQCKTMYQTFKSIRSTIPSAETKVASPTINLLMSQDGLKQADKMTSLPGQPAGVNFQQYAGYVTVDPHAGKALFYYFVESPENSSSKPLILWLNGGPGCSSVGNGAMMELGPFRVRGDGKTLFRNKYAWNNVGNVIFLESPAGVGFSYSNRTSDYDHTGDISTANDAYTFLVNWLERFPEYKSREFYITGESYAGHYVPQLAQTILLRNKNSTHIINLRGIAIGNAWIDDLTSQWGVVDYVWTHALISDQTHQGIHKYCNFMNSTNLEECSNFITQANEESGSIYDYNIYAPLCKESRSKLGSVNDFDPCSDKYVTHYLNLPEVQASLHVRPTEWSSCRDFDWAYWQPTLLPTIKNLINAGLRVWIYSGDVDAVVPVTSTRYSINDMKLEIKEQWRPWYANGEVGGYVVVYDGLTFATVRGAGHMVPTYQPERALVLVSSFLQGSFSSSSSSMITHILMGG